MFVEPLLAFFILRYFRKTLQTTSALHRWNKILTVAMYGVASLFIIDKVLHIGPLTDWIWYTLLLLIIISTFVKPEFAFAKTITFAILPFVSISLFSDIIKTGMPGLYKSINEYLDIAGIFSFIWMVAMFVMHRRQRNALEKERQKTHEEEEQKRWMAARKAELEQVVSERTAELTQQKEELEHALVELKTTQALLIQQEKLASLGELTAGIAHEIQNPLNFVNNFSEVSTELVEELKVDLEKKLPEGDKVFVDDILSDLTKNLEKITHHGKRADAIVKGMMQHSRSNTGQKELTDLNALADEYLHFAYHGLRSKDMSFTARLNTDFDPDLEKVQVVTQDISRVLLNLYTNAFYSILKKKKQSGSHFAPAINVSTKRLNKIAEIHVRDNGNGINGAILEKIFQPFFTTKPAGEGIGLGLSLSYDIIKAHEGELKVKTKEGEFAEFIIQLPIA